MSHDDAVNVTDPFGKIGSLPRTKVNEALDNGYKLATPEEVHIAKNEERFGGVQGSIFAGTLGAARTASLGFSDLALTSMPKEYGGFSPEQLKGLSETNPVSTVIGEIGGVLRDPLGLASMINKGSAAATKGAKTILGAAKEAKAATRTEAVLESTFRHSMEGAVYGGIASSINDKALGDPGLNGEKILSNVGYGYFLGGASGGALKMLGYGITPAIRKAVDTLGELRNDLVGSGYGEKALISKVLPTRLSEAVTDRQLNLDTQGQAATLRKMANNLNTVTDLLQGEVRRFDTEVHSGAMDSLFKSSAKWAGKAQQNVASYVSDVVEKLKPIMSEPGTKEALDKLKNISQADALKKGTSKAIFDSLGTLKTHLNDFFKKEPMLKEAFDPVVQDIDKFMKDPSIFGAAGAASVLHKENVEMLRKYISASTSELTPFQKTFGNVKDGKWGFDLTKLHEAFMNKDPIQRTANLNILDDFYAHISEMPDNIMNAKKTIPNSSWKKETLKKIIDNSEKSHEQAFNDYLEGIKTRRPMYGWKDYAPVLIAKWHPVLAAAIEAYDFYQDPVHWTHDLSFIERMIGNTTKKSLDLIDNIFDPSKPARLLIEKNKDKIERSENTEDEMRKIKKYAFNPELISQGFEKETKEMNSVAPNITEFMNLANNNALAFLASKIPHSGNSFDPLDDSFKPSRAEISKFESYRRIVNNPLASLEQIKDRTITRETVETLATVYPKLYEEMKASVLQKYFKQMANKKAVPYQTKQAISIFLGEPIDSALMPQSILANQMSFPMPQPPQGAGSFSKSGAGKLTVAERTSPQRPPET